MSGDPFQGIIDDALAKYPERVVPVDLGDDALVQFLKKLDMSVPDWQRSQMTKYYECYVAEAKRRNAKLLISDVN